ncbi:hypothetical protein F5Y17DRAFT_468293 [Xylariaceae sp. FL0594]|nr:hypothetical protein F5Y17DRAFT_468293 [Xylariaceae sp. FL0594]
MRNATVLAGATNSSSPAADQLDQLVTDDVSSCSDTWMAVNDVEIGGGTDDRTGFNSAVRRFCDAADGKIVKEDGYLSMATETFLSAGKDPSSYGILGYVYFEVHNKESGDHTVESSACQEHLGKLSAVGSKCYGAEHKDTKGGTYQVGTMAISYHAFGKAVPPTEKTALNNIFEGQALTAQTVNTGGAAPLNPWPLDSLSAVKPVPCHSHNDYDRSIPLFESLAAGCIGTEADVWLSGGDVIIGHILPKPGRTLRAQYVEPLVQIISHNGGSVYKSAPQQTLTLLIDFKTSDTKTLDAVVRALEPLREAGYLSRRDPTTGEFLRGAVTVSASGSAPFDRISQGDGVPNRDVFYDAPLGNLAGGNYTKDKGSFTASADFQDAVSPDANIGADELAKLRDQVGKAHDRGLVARYWNLPSDSIWEQLRAEGVDLLNGDDMKATARLPRLGQEMKRFRLGGPIFRFIRT